VREKTSSLSVAVSAQEREWFRLRIQAEGKTVVRVVREIAEGISKRVGMKSYLISQPRQFAGSPRITVKCSPDLIARAHRNLPHGLGLGAVIREELLRAYDEPPAPGEEDWGIEDDSLVPCPRCGPPHVLLPRPERGDRFCCNCRYTTKGGST
jgi:hypothetical protein